MRRYGSALEIEILENSRAALEQHASECGDEVHAVLLNPGNFELLGIAELWGILVLACDDVPPKRARIFCERLGRLEPVEDTEQLSSR
jgi:hypothetical protein